MGRMSTDEAGTSGFGAALAWLDEVGTSGFGAALAWLDEAGTSGFGAASAWLRASLFSSESTFGLALGRLSMGAASAAKRKMH
jgi:hypothetical protein